MPSPSEMSLHNPATLLTRYITHESSGKSIQRTLMLRFIGESGRASERTKALMSFSNKYPPKRRDQMPLPPLLSPSPSQMQRPWENKSRPERGAGGGGEKEGRKEVFPIRSSFAQGSLRQTERKFNPISSRSVCSLHRVRRNVASLNLTHSMSSMRTAV